MPLAEKKKKEEEAGGSKYKKLGNKRTLWDFYNGRGKEGPGTSCAFAIDQRYGRCGIIFTFSLHSGRRMRSRQKSFFVPRLGREGEREQHQLQEMKHWNKSTEQWHSSQEEKERKKKKEE